MPLRLEISDNPNKWMYKYRSAKILHTFSRKLADSPKISTKSTLFIGLGGYPGKFREGYNTHVPHPLCVRPWLGIRMAYRIVVVLQFVLLAGVTYAGTCYGGTAKLRCPSNQRITVRSGHYGRWFTGGCTYRASDSTSCYAGGVTEKVKSL